jgi:aminomethyltransferase
MAELLRTPLYEEHVAAGAQMVEFGGWEMPVQYKGGIIAEHLACRKKAGLFDVSHMGRFIVQGQNALSFLQHALTNNAAALELDESQYTMVPDPDGYAIDDAYLYRFEEDRYLLVVNAANREKNLAHFGEILPDFVDVELIDQTTGLAMISLQGPASKDILSGMLTGGRLPEPMRNALCTAEIDGAKVMIGRTGYTGEPLCFELFVDSGRAADIWRGLVQRGAVPVGLGARDTLRLEAGLPLYGHELGNDPEGNPIPIFACPLARFAVSFSRLKGDFIGRDALLMQFEAFKWIVDRDFRNMAALPRIIQPVALTGKGIARAGAKITKNGLPAGFVTSGTMVPYWKVKGTGIDSRLGEETGRRAVALALVNADIVEGDRIDIDIRGKQTPAVVVPYFLRNEAPPYAWPVLHDELSEERKDVCAADEMFDNVRDLVGRAVENHLWRQKQCINLIPSEQTASPLTRLLSITDPSGRYAEHKPVKAFKEADVFYYQGTDFICEVEYLLKCELQKFLGCTEVEPRVISGQMANTAVFSAMVDFLNRADRKREQRRIRKVMNNHIIKGGHLSAQPMGALRDFVKRDPVWEKPAVVNFPVLDENPYKIDMEETEKLIAEHRPELIILGKSMVLHKEPVAEIRKIIDEVEIPDCVLMYDMAHVLGLVGPYFQEPFKEGADIVTGSTHKTFFGTQRGMIGVNFTEDQVRWDLWEAIQRRAFPGAMSNHHLGTLLGLLLAAYEMNAFKEPYQKAVVENAKAFATALADAGLSVAGDPAISYTETHQVVINVGYGRGPEIARRLEQNNIICNYQAAPEEEGFTASGSLRTGVQEMTRFGMGPADFAVLAGLIAEVIEKDRNVRKEVVKLREKFFEMRYCFTGKEVDEMVARVSEVLR